MGDSTGKVTDEELLNQVCKGSRIGDGNVDKANRMFDRLTSPSANIMPNPADAYAYLQSLSWNPKDWSNSVNIAWTPETTLNTPSWKLSSTGASQTAEKVAYPTKQGSVNLTADFKLGSSGDTAGNVNVKLAREVNTGTWGEVDNINKTLSFSGAANANSHLYINDFGLKSDETVSLVNQRYKLTLTLANGTNIRELQNVTISESEIALSNNNNEYTTPVWYKAGNATDLAGITASTIKWLKEGDYCYQDDTNVQYRWTGSAWEEVTTSAAHAKQHAITSTSDHTSTATSGQILKADANGLPVNATNTDSEVASAVSLKHTQGSDTALGTLSAKNPPVDADLMVLRDSASSWALFTTTCLQFWTYLKGKADLLYEVAGAVATHLLAYDHTKIHTQNTDTGTTASSFVIDSDAIVPSTIANELGVITVFDHFVVKTSPALGRIILDVTTGASDKGLLLTNVALTGNRVATFPDATGTVALTSDLHTQGTDQGLDYGGASAVTAANCKTAYDHSQDNSQAHSDYLINNGDDTTTGDLTISKATPLFKATDTSGNEIQVYSDTNGNYVKGKVNVQGQPSQAIQLNGSSQYVKCGDVLDFEYNVPFSGECWFYCNSVSGVGELIDKLKNNSPWNGWCFLRSTNKLAFVISQSYSVKCFDVITTDAVFSAGNWYHVAFSYDGSNTVAGIKLYVNGVSKSLTTSYNLPMDGTIGTTVELCFGCRNLAEKFLDGSIDEVVIYNDVRTPTEITASYALGVGLYHTAETNLVGLWHFDNDALDSSGNGYNGTLVGSPSYVTGVVNSSAAYTLLEMIKLIPNIGAGVKGMILLGADGTAVRFPSLTTAQGAAISSPGNGTAFYDSTLNKLAVYINGAYKYFSLDSYVHPNHSGDVTSVADGATTIGAGKVTLAMQANLVNSTVIGRITAGTGVPEALTSANLKTILGGYIFVPRTTTAYDYYIGGGVGHALTADGAYHNDQIDLTSIVPAGTVAVVLNLYSQDDAAGTYVQIRTSSTVAFAMFQRCTPTASNNRLEITFTILLDSGRCLDFYADTGYSEFYVQVVGWYI